MTKTATMSAQDRLADLQARARQVEASEPELWAAFRDAALAGDLDELIVVKRQLDDLPTLRLAMRLARAYVAIAAHEERLEAMGPSVEAAKSELREHVAEFDRASRVVNRFASLTGSERRNMSQEDMLAAKHEHERAKAALETARVRHAFLLADFEEERRSRLALTQELHRAEAAFRATFTRDTRTVIQHG